MSAPRVLTLDEIKSVLPAVDLLAEMKTGFIAYSRGECVIPPVGELVLEDEPPGEVHIKYGYIRGGDHYVIKVASGFPMNHQMGISTSNGLMLLFDQRTGELAAVLMDEGYLTDARTAAAGALASRTLAPSTVNCIGIIGTGLQARMQLVEGARALGCKEAMIWGRNEEHVARLKSLFDQEEISVRAATSAEEVAQGCEVIVTCTSAKTPILQKEWIRPGTHITAVGSDTPSKQELDASILASADRVVVDSIDQGRLRGEVARALEEAVIKESDVVELGAVLADPKQGRTTDKQITVADLTGVAVQDLKIAEAVSALLMKS